VPKGTRWKRVAEDVESVYDVVMWILSDGFHYDLVEIGVAEVDKIRIVR
jgi:hypothetical protein